MIPNGSQLFISADAEPTVTMAMVAGEAMYHVGFWTIETITIVKYHSTIETLQVFISADAEPAVTMAMVVEEAIITSDFE